VARTIIPFNGHLRIRAWEKQADGTEKMIKDDTIKNLIVDVGTDAIMKRIANMSGGGYATQIGVGDSSTAAASRRRNNSSCSRQSKFGNRNTNHNT